jgi:cyclopropane-fatty-acyl-phospholipid synthase
MHSTAREVESSDGRLRAAPTNGTVPLKPIGVEEPPAPPPHAERPDLVNKPELPAPAEFPRRTSSRANGRNWQRHVVRQVLALGGNPPLTVVLPDGDEVRASTEPPIAWIHVRDRGVLRRVFCNPFYQFGEAYTDGGLQVEGDLVEVLTAIEHSMRRAASNGLLAKFYSWMARRPRRHSLAASRENIHHHYDIGNDFYKLWLDDSLAYTCAYFPTPDASLEAAQTAKFDHVCRKLRLRAGETVVEAGCGWGGLALHMARQYGVTVRAYNISREQVEYARHRAVREGLRDRVEFVEDDWRNMDGHYDVFASVGMLEHVGLPNYRRLGEAIHRCLREDGRGLIHTIGRNRPQPVDPWIERRIFPGSYAPTLGQMMRIFEPRNFSVLDVENLRLHYAQTLRHWLVRFEQSVDAVAAMFDERFVRMWRLYLSGSIAAFQAGGTQLFQVVFARGTSNEVPMTRTHLYPDAE